MDRDVKLFLGEGGCQLTTNKWATELKLMTELSGWVFILDVSSKFNPQLFPGPEQTASHPHVKQTRDQGSHSV